MAAAWRVAAVALFAVTLLPNVATATTCLPMPLASLVRDSPAIFEATVRSLDRWGMPPPQLPGAPPPPPDLNPLVVVTLAEVVPLRGPRLENIVAPPGVVAVGHRYLFITHRTALAVPAGIGGCGGMARPAAYASGLRDWLGSLATPSTGGRVFGNVLRRERLRDGRPASPVEGARVYLRGPVSRKTATDVEGGYAFGDLPDGTYTVSVGAPSSMVLDAPASVTATLQGPQAGAIADSYVAIDGAVRGRVTDEDGQPRPNLQVYLHVAPSVGVADDHTFALARSTADGSFVFRGVPPGRYVVTLQDRYLPVYAESAQTGDPEIVLGWAEAIDLAPIVARDATTVLVEGVVTDAQGRAVNAGLDIEVIGAHGIYPKSSSNEAAVSGAFVVRLTPGLTYRFTFTASASARHVEERVVTGAPLVFVVRWP